MDSKIAESSIEAAFNKGAKDRGLRSLKYGINGWPDRVLLCKGGGVIWVELKKPGEKPRALQYRRHEQLRREGHSVYVLSTLEEVAEFWLNY